jgi:hypothetical protein
MVMGGILLTLGAYGKEWPPLVTVYIDDTPPVLNPITPTDATTYATLTEVSAEIYDPESYLDSRNYPIVYLDGISYLMISKGDNIWAYHAFSYSHKRPGTHTFKFEATNRLGLTTEVSGTYYIYEGLNGTWFINGIVIHSSVQTIKLTTRTLAFQFEKTQGLNDDLITCIVDWDKTGNPEQGSMTLENSAEGIWTGTRTFVGGQYAVDLLATDGFGSITMTLYGVGVNNNIVLPTFEEFLMFIGTALIVVGFLMHFRKRKR